MAAGQTAAAIGEAKTARELDPFSAFIAMYGGITFFMARQYDATIKEEMAALGIDSQSSHAHYWLGYAYEQKGMYKEAIAEYERVEHDFPQGLLLAAMGRSFLLGGDFKKAAVARRKIEHFPGDGVWPPYDAALFYAVLGDNDRAFDSLEKELRKNTGWLLFLKVDPRLSPLRSDPRFADLVQRAGLPQ
jgi:tetratricopeptide (TPR) repeat protein